MEFVIDELTVYFPHREIYSEQEKYMKELKNTLDRKQHGVIHMGVARGKTTCLLSLITSYILSSKREHEKPLKLLYCVNNADDMQKVLSELKEVERCQKLFQPEMHCADVVVVYPYEHLLDPKLGAIISKEINKESCIVVIDDADNLDNLDHDTVIGAEINVERLHIEVEAVRDKDRLRAEYEKLKAGMRDDHLIPPIDMWRANPALPDDTPVQPMSPEITDPDDFLRKITFLLYFLNRYTGHPTSVKEDHIPFGFILDFKHHEKLFQSDMDSIMRDLTHSLEP